MIIQSLPLAFLLGDATPMDLFIMGKEIMWPMILVSFVMITVVIERLLFIFRENSSREPEVVEKMLEAVERRDAVLHGWHRALRMRSRVNRGTPQQPGLVFALLPGGACRGMVYRLRPENGEEELDRLWAREMPTGVYDPRLLPCRTPQGPVVALAFTLSPRSEACLPRLPDAELLHVLRHAKGRYGTTLDYLAQTADSLRAHGLRDREIERLMQLARRHGLL